MAPTVTELLRDHVQLSIRCTDRLYVNGYVPPLYTPGQLVYFLKEHRGWPFPSPVLLNKMRSAYVEEVDAFTRNLAIDVVRFGKERKDEVANALRNGFTAPVGVVFVGVAQEKQKSFKGKKRKLSGGHTVFDFSRQPVYVNQYYFYVQDPEWGPAFVKVGSYLPFPVKLCLNGHEWAKQQARKEGLAFESLDNGFLCCEDPEQLQSICDRLGPEDIRSFYERWRGLLPWPLAPADWAAGYDHRLTVWQAEFSQTDVFDRPVHGRHFFEQVIRENIDLGRPDRVQLVFGREIRRGRTKPPRHGYRTRVITQGVNPSLHAFYKTSSVKQYFKEERALRTETTINRPWDYRVLAGIEYLPKLAEIGHETNERLLETQRLSEACVLATEEREAIEQTTRVGQQRAPGLRLGDRRVFALLNALCLFLHVHAGFRNRDLRAHVARLLGLDPATYPVGRMTYDLRRLRLKGLIRRVPKTHRYQLTEKGVRVAVFYTRLELRVLRPAWAAVDADNPAPSRLRKALRRVDSVLDAIRDDAGLKAAA